MFSDKNLFTFIKAAVSVLCAVCLFAAFYFGNGIMKVYAFKKDLEQMYDITALIDAIHKERAMQTLLVFEDDIDPQNVEILRALTNRRLNKINFPQEFKDKLEAQRAGFDRNITSEELLEFYKPVDNYFLDYLDKFRAKNVNTELNGLLIAIWQSANDTVRQNQIRDFLLRFCDNKLEPNEDELQMLDDLYFDYAKYPEILKLNNIYPSYATFNYIDLEGITKIIKEKMVPLWVNIEQFYDVIHDTITTGKTEISYAKLIDITKRIDAQNIDIAKYMVDVTKDEVGYSLRIMWIYEVLSVSLILYCLAAFTAWGRRRNEIIKDANLLQNYVSHLKEVALRRGVEADDKGLKEMFVKISEFIDDADLIERKNRNEYSFFMNNISHEIQNPLNTIYGYAQLLENKKDASNEEKKLYAKSIMKSSQQLKKLFENLLRVANIQSGSEENQILELDSATLLSPILQEYTIKARENSMELEAFVDPNLEGTVSLDAKKIKFILSTLLDNAIRYNRRNEKIVLYIRATELENQMIKVSVMVADRGNGYEIDKSKDDNFLDIDSNTKVKIYNQKGLNLAIAREYLKQLGVQLYVNTQKGVGTSFSYTLEHKFVPNTEYRNKFNNEKIYIYGDKNEYSENSLPILHGSGVPDKFNIMEGYLKYLGFDVEYTKEEGKPIYILFDETEPFKMEKCIYCINEEPSYIGDNRAYLPRAFCLQALVNAYESVMHLPSKDSNKMHINVLVLASEEIANILKPLVNKVSLAIEEGARYDMAFVDTDSKVSEVEKIPLPCQIVALSYDGNTPSHTKVVYSHFILKEKTTKDENGIEIGSQKDYSKEINDILIDYRSKQMQTSKKLHDVLLFKNSVASNNIYKGAILSFASSVDIANSITELEDLLREHPYKVVLCDYDISGLTLDKYQDIIQRARFRHHCEIVAGMFVPRGVHIYAKFFEEIPANLSKSELEMRIRKHL